MSEKSINCNVYRCSKKDEMYLYVRDNMDIDELPANLTAVLGSLTHVMDLSLTPERSLAREDVAAVMTALADKGYFVQLPPTFVESATKN